MNKFGLALTAMFLLFSACNAQNKSQSFSWKEFVSNEGEFKAVFPIIPTKSVKEIDGGISKLQITKFEVSLLEPEIYFGVLYTDFPNAPIMNQDTLKTYYDSLRDNLPNLSGAELINERDVYVDGKLGREFILKDKKQIVVTQRNYLIGKRSFQIITSTKSSLMDDDEFKSYINKFLDSFQLIKK